MIGYMSSTGLVKSMSGKVLGCVIDGQLMDLDGNVIEGGCVDETCEVNILLSLLHLPSKRCKAARCLAQLGLVSQHGCACARLCVLYTAATQGVGICAAWEVTAFINNKTK